MSMGHWRADSVGPPCLAHCTVRLSLGFLVSRYNQKSHTPTSLCYSLHLVSGLTSIPTLILLQMIPAFNYPQCLSTSNHFVIPSSLLARD
jgi:hypothetical protein